MPIPAAYPDFHLEKESLFAGKRLIAGIDEAGRGALAGPLCIGIVIFDSSTFQSIPEIFSSITDSKNLTPSARETAYEIIREHSLHCSFESVSSDEVDFFNVNQATFIAIERGYEKLTPKPDHILLDGTFCFKTLLPIQSVKKGDSLSLSIAAASICAKVERDRIMKRYAEVYPHYGFETHVGYGTTYHRTQIEKHGPCKIHRRSYEPVKSWYESRKSNSD
jgi:ribonuclease HII